MGLLTVLFLLLVSWIFLSTALQFYTAFHSPRCEEPLRSRGGPCLGPLFSEGELVDFFVFLTTEPKLRWWTSDGLEALRAAPLWNATAVRYGASVEASKALVPLSLDVLRGVRQNESQLFAHCFMIRGGRGLDAVMDPSNSSEEPGEGGGLLGLDTMHAATRVTKPMPQVSKPRRNLLANATAGDEEAQSVYADVPLFGQVQVYPTEALMWLGASFATTAFFQPSMPLAAFRSALLVAAPWLWKRRREQQELVLAAKRKRKEDAKVLLGDGWLDVAPEIVPHLMPKLTLSLSFDSNLYSSALRPPLLYKKMVFQKDSPMPVGERDVRYRVVDVPGASGKRYLPVVTVDDFGMRSRHWRALDSNVSREDPALQVEVAVQDVRRYSVVQTLKESLQVYFRMGIQERDLEDIKDFLFRYPLHIMALMQLIGFAQTILTTLAFKNDITFFKGRSDYTGLSSRSLMTDTLQEIIIFLYLWDFDEISRILLFQTGTSSAISAWKYARVARLGVFWKFSLPWVSYNRAVGGQNEAEQATEDIDRKGMEYLKYVLYPLSAMWGLYNLYYSHYKSWWSWMISSMADFAYTFGFINMMPQIFINYKLKSVAHMPWRVLIYKFFNTFIDDVFAFFIMSDYMSKKHRFMTLRDDIVFLIFLYQRRIYKVDTSRPDEYGFVYAEDNSGAGKPPELGASTYETAETEVTEGPGQAQPPALKDSDASEPGADLRRRLRREAPEE